MSTFTAVCLGVLAATHLLGLVFWIVMLLQLRRAAESIEVLAYRAQDEVAKVGHATETLRSFAGSISSGWGQALAAGLGMAGAAWVRRGNKANCGHEHCGREEKARRGEQHG